MEGVASSASPIAGEAWRESMDSGALNPPRRSRGCVLSDSSLSEPSSSGRELAGIKAGGPEPEPERHGRNAMGWGGDTGLLVLPLISDQGITEGATSCRRRLNGKKRRAPVEPNVVSSELGTGGAHVLSVLGMGNSSDDLGSSESAVVLYADRRRVAKSLKSTVLERIGRRILA